MLSAEFEGSLGELVALASERIVAMVCAEAVPWRCHRSLMGDALLVRGIEVQDIMSARLSKPHKLTSWAQVDGFHILYPPQEETPR